MCEYRKVREIRLLPSLSSIFLNLVYSRIPEVPKHIIFLLSFLFAKQHLIIGTRNIGHLTS